MESFVDYFYLHSNRICKTNLKNKNEASWINEWSGLLHLSYKILRKYMS